MKIEEIVKKFGVRPHEVGNRYRGHWIIEEPDDVDSIAGAEKGDLCVKARDGASNPIDPGAFQIGNCVGSAEDDFDCTFRYYYYRALTPTPESKEE